MSAVRVDFSTGENGAVFAPPYLGRPVMMADEPVADEPVAESAAAILRARAFELAHRSPLRFGAATFVIGLVFGLIVLGWWLFPVKWVGLGPDNLTVSEQMMFVDAVSDLHAYQGDVERTRKLLNYWRGDQVACLMAMQTHNWAESMRLQTAAFVANGGLGCTSYWEEIANGE